MTLYPEEEYKNPFDEEMEKLREKLESEKKRLIKGWPSRHIATFYNFKFDEFIEKVVGR